MPLDDPAAEVAAAPPRQAAGLHGFVASFEEGQEEWSEYVERLDHYFVANDIDSDAKRKAIRINCKERQERTRSSRMRLNHWTTPTNCTPAKRTRFYPGERQWLSWLDPRAVPWVRRL